MTIGLRDRIDCADEPRPHDLLWIAGIEALQATCPLPDWVQEAIAAMPVVVVRRAIFGRGEIPVGIRGQSRAERFAALVAPYTVHRRAVPEELAKTMLWRENHRPEFAQLRKTLDAIACEWSAISWGPAGSVGFELATGVPVTTCESDLDLVIHAPQPISRREAVALQQFAEEFDVPTDVRIETPYGSVALREYAWPATSQILMKTAHGPKLVTDPWADFGPGPMQEAARGAAAR